MYMKALRIEMKAIALGAHLWLRTKTREWLRRRNNPKFHYITGKRSNAYHVMLQLPHNV